MEKGEVPGWGVVDRGHLRDDMMLLPNTSGLITSSIIGTSVNDTRGWEPLTSQRGRSLEVLKAKPMKEPISPLAVSPISFSPLIERSEFHNKTRVCGIFLSGRRGS